MKVEKLQPGQTFKNYKVLCSELGIPIKNGKDSKEAQYKEIARYCKYTRSGHSFIIEEMYQVPKEKIDNRGKSEGSRSNNNVYNNAIQLLITDLLAQCENNGGKIPNNNGVKFPNNNG
ncbi:hypothetical protein M3196_10125 [Fictibacillus nanhaiensis]|uniref:hypothetical protein n=1 Tax=Fictibacillus nanhaiensis TaxID=742169 RepID=UPI002040870C|nr:hypothetical protein [Fictibacillus nanhaiensis]MCM3732015.1 hypothetical protein [Fictibacillus nanhaiensis]